MKMRELWKLFRSDTFHSTCANGRKVKRIKSCVIISLIPNIIMFLLLIALASFVSICSSWFKYCQILRECTCALSSRTLGLHSGCSILMKADNFSRCCFFFSSSIPFFLPLLLRTSSPLIDMIWQEIFERQRCANCPEISTVCSCWRRSWTLASY